MKTVILSLLFLMAVNLPGGETVAQNVWYVDRDAPTNVRDGRSWETAWTNTDSAWMGGHGINWDIIQAGDTIYISGGTDSTRYDNVFGTAPSIRGVVAPPEAPSFNPQVVLTRAWHEGHNGEVYFRNTDTTSQAYSFLITNISGVKLVGLNFYKATNQWFGQTAVLVTETERITFENCTFTNERTGAALGLGGSFHVLENCLIQNLTNDNPHDQDIFGLGEGKGGHRIVGNTIIQRQLVDSTDAHPDMMQIVGWYGDLTGYYETLFLNNFIWQITPNRKSDYNAGFYISSGANLTRQKFTFINNIYVMQLPDTNHRGLPNSVPAIFLRGECAECPGTPPAEYSLRLYNNVIMYPSASILASRGDSVFARNNYFGITNDIANGHIFLSNQTYIDTINLDFNHYSVRNWTAGKRFYDGWNNHTFGQWQALGQDVNSDTSHSSLFAYDSVITAYMPPEALRGRGENLSYLASQYPEIMYDILGNPRPLTGPWDIGALQFQGGQSGNVNVNGKIFLQGPFNSNSMTTFLSQGSLLPVSQPYNMTPWNYSGNEVLSLPAGQAGSNVVDWVLVELRNSSNPSQVVSRRAAVLRNDGILLEPNGVVGVRFTNIPEGLYHIAVFHRNHLAVMSAAPVQLSANSQLYDFTTSMNKAYGTNPMANLTGGRFGMYAGDGNGNGGINITDRNEIWQPQNGTLGYLKGDFNLNGGVTIHDINLFWNVNNGTMSQVP